MSAKRSATNDLNADNWNEEIEIEEKGVFQTASSEELKNRVIRKARRKCPSSDPKALGEEDQSIFGGFKGFGKSVSTATTVGSSPFSFLSKMSSNSVLSKDTESDGADSKEIEKNSNNNNYGLDKSTEYCKKLRSLNNSVLNWIKTHVESNPICILTPIFKDYENYLKDIEAPQAGVGLKINTPSSADSQNKKPSESFKQFKFSSSESTVTKMNSLANSVFSAPSSLDAESISEKATKSSEASDIKSSQNTDSSSTASKINFSFGSKPETKAPTVNAGFSFGAAAPSFSFASEKSFSFGNIAKPAHLIENKPSGNETNEGDEDDEPPKVDFKPVLEEDSIYTKKCKVFVKNDENYADRGVGTLFLKPIKDQKRTQLLVRADTNLGNVLLNIILNDTIPTRRMGKNNVMIVCCLSSESDKPTQILLRVKTGEDADELLQIIDKHKVTVD